MIKNALTTIAVMSGVWIFGQYTGQNNQRDELQNNPDPLVQSLTLEQLQKLKNTVAQEITRKLAEKK